MINLNLNKKKLTLDHPTAGTTLEGQPYCQYCAEPFKDVLLHKDKFLSTCNHAYCLDCFAELMRLKKGCTICNKPMQLKIQPCQNPNKRFRAKSQVRSSYSLHIEDSQGKLKMVKINGVNGVSPFPLIDNYQENKSWNMVRAGNKVNVVSPIVGENSDTNMDISKLHDDYPKIGIWSI